MQGRRVPDGTHPLLYDNGDYGQFGGVYNARTPTGHLGELRLHDITEHPDRTITVRQAIHFASGPTEVHYHGYLDHGVWRSHREEQEP